MFSVNMGSSQSKSYGDSSSSSVKHCYLLSKNCTSPDMFTIKDSVSGNTFKVKDAGIRFTLLTVQRNQDMAHFGLLCDDNTFITPDGKNF